MSRFAPVTKEATSEDDEPQEKEAEFFRLIALNKDVFVKITENPMTEEATPSHVSLLAASSTFGYFVAGTDKGFIYGSLSALRATFKSAAKQSTPSFTPKTHVVVSEGAVHHIRLSADQQTVFVGVAKGVVFLYDLPETNPYKTLRLEPIDIRDLRPNPGEKTDLLAVLFTNNKGVIIDTNTGAITTTIPNNALTALCWSPKGKQIVCGTLDARLLQYGPEGSLKMTTEPPAGAKWDAPKYGRVEQSQSDETKQASSYSHNTFLAYRPSHLVQDVLWVDNAIFIAVYAEHRNLDEPDQPHSYDAYAIAREGKTKVIYTRLGEICLPWGIRERGAHYYMELIRNWQAMRHHSDNHRSHPLHSHDFIYYRGANVKHIVLMASTPSADIGVVGHDSDKNEWAVWMLDETCRAQLPLSKTTDADTAPLGLALDYSASETISSLTPDMDDTPIPPVPIFLFLNSEGMIGAYHCLNVDAIKNGESYSGMVKANEVPTEGEIDNANGGSTSELAKSLIPKLGALGHQLKPISTRTKPTSFDGFGLATALGGFETSESSFISRPPSPTKAAPPMFDRPASPTKHTPLAFARPPSPTKSVAPSFPRLAITPVVSTAVATDTPSSAAEIPTSGSNLKLVGTKPTTGFFRSDTPASKASTSISTFGGSSLGTSSPSTSFGTSSTTATAPNDSKQALASTFASSLSKTTTAEPAKSLNDKFLIPIPPATTETVKHIAGYVIDSGNASIAATKKTETPSLATAPKASTSTSFMVPVPVKPTFSSASKSAEPKPVILPTASSLDKAGHRLGAGQPQAPNLMQNVPVIKQQRQTMEEGISKEFESAYLALSDELNLLRQNCDNFTQFLANLRRATGSKSTADLVNRASWMLGDMPQVVRLTAELQESAREVREEGGEFMKDVTGMQSDLLKVDTKVEESARFFRARKDPEFAKMVKVRQLGPEHAENQKRLRKSSQLVNDRIREVEEYIVLLKDKVQNQKLGKKAFQPPSLDTIHRTIRNISNSLIDKSIELDDLSTRLERLSIAKGGNVSSSKYGLFHNDGRLGDGYGTANNKRWSEAAARSAADFFRKERLCDRLKKHMAASKRIAPITNDTIVRPSNTGARSQTSLDHSLFSVGNGPVILDPSNAPRKVGSGFNDKSMTTVDVSESRQSKANTVPGPQNLWAAAGFKIPSAAPGAWTCPMCSVSNKPDAAKCIACETDNPNAKKPAIIPNQNFWPATSVPFGSTNSQSGNETLSSGGFSFGKSTLASSPFTSGFKFPSAVSNTSTNATEGFGFAAPAAFSTSAPSVPGFSGGFNPPSTSVSSGTTFSSTSPFGTVAPSINPRFGFAAAGYSTDSVDKFSPMPKQTGASGFATMSTTTKISPGVLIFGESDDEREERDDSTRKKKRSSNIDQMPAEEEEEEAEEEEEEGEEEEDEEEGLEEEVEVEEVEEEEEEQEDEAYIEEEELSGEEIVYTEGEEETEEFEEDEYEQEEVPVIIEEGTKEMFKTKKPSPSLTTTSKTTNLWNFGAGSKTESAVGFGATSKVMVSDSNSSTNDEKIEGESKPQHGFFAPGPKLGVPAFGLQTFSSKPMTNDEVKKNETANNDEMTLENVHSTNNDAGLSGDFVSLGLDTSTGTSAKVNPMFGLSTGSLDHGSQPSSTTTSKIPSGFLGFKASSATTTSSPAATLSPFGVSTTSAFGQNSPAPVSFGGTPAAPAFGSATPFGAAAAPAFGVSTPLGGPATRPVFGQPSSLSTNVPVFGSATSFGGSTSFGSASFAQAAPFGQATAQAANNASPFAQATAQAANIASPFATANTSGISPFGQAAAGSGPFGSTAQPFNAFNAQSQQSGFGSFGAPGAPQANKPAASFMGHRG